MTANLPTDAIEECIAFHETLSDTDVRAKAQLRALKDAALLFSLICRTGVYTRGEEDEAHSLGIFIDGYKHDGFRLEFLATWHDMKWTINADGDGKRERYAVVTTGPIVNGLPVLDEAARRALGES